MNFENDPLGEMSIRAMEEQGRKEPPCSLISDPQADVRQFMAAFGQALPATPQWPDDDTMDLRVRLVAEEFCEWLRDSGYSFTAIVAHSAPEFSPPVYSTANWSTNNNQRSLPKSADALIDLLYVTIGSLLAMGIDMGPLWQAVHAANMAKAGGPVVNGKVRKPENWQPPDIEKELRKQGWKEEEAKQVIPMWMIAEENAEKRNE